MQCQKNCIVELAYMFLHVVVRLESPSDCLTFLNSFIVSDSFSSIPI